MNNFFNRVVKSAQLTGGPLAPYKSNKETLIQETELHGVI